MIDPASAYLAAKTPETAHAAYRHMVASSRAYIAQEQERMAAKPDAKALRYWLAAWAVVVVAVSIAFYLGRITS
jgi:hypothetical protein